MQWSDISFAPTSRTLRQFAGLGAAVLAGLAFWQGYQGGNTTAGVVLLSAAAAIGLLGLIWPQALRWLFVGWLVVVFPVGWLVSRLVLAVMFFGVITPVALVFRLVGRDVLKRRPQPEATTYWSLKPAPIDVRSYYRQF